MAQSCILSLWPQKSDSRQAQFLHSKMSDDRHLSQVMITPNLLIEGQPSVLEQRDKLLFVTGVNRGEGIRSRVVPAWSTLGFRCRCIVNYVSRCLEKVRITSQFRISISCLIGNILFSSGSFSWCCKESAWESTDCPLEHMIFGFQWSSNLVFFWLWIFVWQTVAGLCVSGVRVLQDSGEEQARFGELAVLVPVLVCCVSAVKSEF